MLGTQRRARPNAEHAFARRSGAPQRMSAATGVPPFDSAKLDALMEEAGVDLVLASSRHNVRYLLGDYSTFFAALRRDRRRALSPAARLPAWRPDLAFLVDCALDRWRHEHAPAWIGAVRHGGVSATLAIDAARELVGELGLRPATVAVDPGSCRRPQRDRSHPRSRRPRSSTARRCSRSCVRSSDRTSSRCARRVGTRRRRDDRHREGRGPRATTREIVEFLHAEEIRRGLDFEYCLIAAGASFNRDASDAVWAPGVRALARLRRLPRGLYRRPLPHGRPRRADPGAAGVHAEVLAMQIAAEGAVRAGATGAEVYAIAAEEQATLPHRDTITFVAHGVGLISHEAPRFTDSGPIPYAATHRIARSRRAWCSRSRPSSSPDLRLHQARGHARRDRGRVRALRRAPRVDRGGLTHPAGRRRIKPMRSRSPRR